MNRKDFRSAYDKIALSDECKADMKRRLMEKLAEEKGYSEGEAEEFHPAQEIKLPQKKRSPLKTAAVVGSVSAAAAALAVGAGLYFSGDPLLPQDNTSGSEIATKDAQDPIISTEEATNEAEQYYSQKCANGVLYFQELTRTASAHSRPQTAFDSGLEALDRLVSTYPYMESLANYEVVERVTNGTPASWRDHENRPLGDELFIQDAWYSDSGMAIAYYDSTASKQVYFSVSTDENEFVPLTMPDGGYLIPAGENRSTFAIGRKYNFLDPELWTMGAGSAAVGDEEYFSAVYSFSANGEDYFCRLDAKNITREQFISCLGEVAPVNLRDHFGYYNSQGILVYDETSLVSNNEILPDAEAAQTAWGELRLNALTTAEMAGGYYLDFPWNICYSSKEDEDVPAPYAITDEDAAEYAGLDVLKSLSETAGELTEVVYYASYDGITSPVADHEDRGANLEMLPGDDPEQFKEAQRFVETSVIYEGTVETVYASNYTTDKLDYFSAKTRTGALYRLYYTGENDAWVQVTVLDDWTKYYDGMLFGQYPLEESSGFIKGSDGSSPVIAGKSVMGGQTVYMGGFITAEGRYVVLKTTNLKLNSFAKLMAELYTNDPDPAATADISDIAAEHITRDVSGYTEQKYPVGNTFYNELRTMEYDPDTGYAEFFSSAAEAFAAYEKMTGQQLEPSRGAEILSENGWTFVPEKSAMLDFGDGQPEAITLDYVSGDREVRAAFSYRQALSLFPIPRITLPDGKVISCGGDAYESWLYSRQTIRNMSYLDEKRYSAGICCRYVDDVPYFLIIVTGGEEGSPSWLIDGRGVDEQGMMDVLAALVYDMDKMPECFGTYIGDDSPAESDIVGYANNDEFSLIQLNLLAEYGEPEYLTDSEEAVTPEQARQFIAQTFSQDIALPDGAEITRRSCTGEGGYSSESVTIREQGGRSLRLCRAVNAQQLYGYGERYGAARMPAYRSTTEGLGIKPVIAFGARDDGAEILFGIAETDGEYYSVTAENYSIDEYSRLLAQVMGHNVSE